jgi:hypothetical protein
MDKGDFLLLLLSVGSSKRDVVVHLINTRNDQTVGSQLEGCELENVNLF